MVIDALLLLCGIFYAVLCVFSIVTGLMYASGKKKLNPLELSDKFMSRYTDSDRLTHVIQIGPNDSMKSFGYIHLSVIQRPLEHATFHDRADVHTQGVGICIFF